MYKNILVVVVIVGLCSLRAGAQDPIFSQAFLSPIYLNPAATGAGEHDLRFSAIHRRQWWTIPASFNYTAVSVDKYVPSLKGGFGVLATHGTEGYLKNTGVYGSYSYTICSRTLSVADNGGNPKWFLAMGLQFGVMQRRIDLSKLTFADQLDIDGVIPGSRTGADVAVNNGKWRPDFAAGAFFNYNLTEDSRILLGFSGHHINRPDESLVSTSDTARSQLPVRWGGNIMYTYTNPDRTWSYSAAGLFYRQAQNNSLQIGGEVTQNSYDISLGLWYRSSINFRDMDAFTVTLSINLSGRENTRHKVRAGIAHDAPLGRNRYSYTTGSSELGVVWDMDTYPQDSDNPCKPRITSKYACPIGY
ncbi:MAG: PorP/SprF family type IX secretion system membrane protein [Niastella sp.]|nr:PorP/SprF family type IX secretion system membrane protein [Niastella sp.]